MKTLSRTRGKILPVILIVSVLALMAASLGAAEQTPAPTERSSPIDVGPGRIAWFDITTTNLAASKEFYGKLFAWTYTPLEGTNLAVEINSAETGIGTLRVAEGKLSPFNGVVYVQVNDLVAVCRKAKELGATIAPGFPFNLSKGRGAIAVALDPSGHPFGMYSKTPLPAAAPPAS